MSAISASTGIREAYDAYKARGLKLNMQRGQPSDADFDLSNDLLLAVGPGDVTTPSGVDIRNYTPGAIAGLSEARALFARYLEVEPEQILVWNNASLELQAHVLTMMLLRGPRGAQPWVGTNPTIIVTTPGYDRHFTLLEGLGYSMVAVEMQPDGPDIDAIERLAADPAVRGLLFVPTYSNPTGETISVDKARRLVELNAANPDFTIFADDAYRVHHLSPDDRDTAVNFVALGAEAGNPNRTFVFASTSKITFAGAGLGFVASSTDNIKLLGAYLTALSIGPNKVEQHRHVRFLESYPGGLDGLMTAHANLIAPKFAAVTEILQRQLGETGLATWSRPKGGYFISLDTTLPIADRVIALANEAGVSLTPAGATYPGGRDPKNSNIRLAPTRPALDEVKLAMEVVAACIQLASEEYLAEHPS
jgi:DNA-binding transcriptional MocR family regulator